MKGSVGPLGKTTARTQKIFLGLLGNQQPCLLAQHSPLVSHASAPASQLLPFTFFASAFFLRSGIIQDDDRDNLSS